MESNLLNIVSIHDKKFAKIKLTCVEDKRLSWKAKGIQNYFATRPPTWQIHQSDLYGRSTDGSTSFRAGIQELLDARYFFRIIKRNEKRQIEKWGFINLEDPCTEEEAKNALEEYMPGWELLKMKKITSEEAQKPPLGNLTLGFIPPLIHNKDLNTNQYPSVVSGSKEPSTNRSCENGVFAESSSLDQSSGSQSKELPSIQTNLDLSKKEEAHIPPVKRFGRKFSETISTSKPPSIEEATAGINSLMNGKAQDAKAEKMATKKEKRKQEPLQNTPREILLLMEFWGSQGFKTPDPQRAIKTYNDTITALKQAMNGHLIPGERRKFNPDQIQESMAKFAMFVFDPCYGPTQKYKDTLARKMNLEHFLYSSWSKSEKSYFIKFIDEEVQERKDIPMVPDNHPEVTNKLRNFFFAYPMAGIKKKLTEKEENHFRLASNKLDDLYQRKGHRFCGITNGTHELGDLLCSSLRNFYGARVSKITPSSFSSSFAFSCLVKYMNEKGYFTDNESNQHWETGE